MILMIDDNPCDAELVCLALGEAGLQPEVAIATDGLHAQQLLREGLCAGEDCRVVLLDLNMPRLDGRAFLRWLRDQPGLEELPVLVLSSSESPVDRQDCLALGATDYLVKPMDFGSYRGLIQAIGPYLAAG